MEFGPLKVKADRRRRNDRGFMKRAFAFIRANFRQRENPYELLATLDENGRTTRSAVGPVGREIVPRKLSLRVRPWPGG